MAAKNETNPEVGDIYTAKSKRLGLWYCLQVAEVLAEGVRFVALAEPSSKRPTAKSLPRLEPFLRTYYSFDSKPELVTAAAQIAGLTSAAERVGTAPAVDVSKERFPRQSRVERGIEGLVRQLELQHAWNALPDAARESFRRTKKGHRLVGANRGAVQQVRENPLVYSLVISGFDDGHLDLSGTSVRDLDVNIGGISKITLSEFTTHLELKGNLEALSELKIEHPLDGDELGIKLWGLASRPVPNLGVPRLNQLMLPDLVRVDLALVATHYPALRALSLWGAPGVAEHVGALGRLVDLEKLLVVDLFGFDADEFPDPEKLPNLSSLILESVSKDTGGALEKRFAGTRQLKVTKLRAPEWVKENVGNPFRSWGGRKNVRPADAKAAFEAYLTAQRSIAMLGKGKPKQKDVQDVVKTFVMTLNKLATKSHLETAERDDVIMAFRSLLTGTQVPAETADGWWEQWEDF